MPSTWPGIEPATLGIEGQRYTNSPTKSTTAVYVYKLQVAVSSRSVLVKWSTREWNTETRFSNTDEPMGTVDKLTDCIGYKYPRRRHPAHTIFPRLLQRCSYSIRERLILSQKLKVSPIDALVDAGRVEAVFHAFLNLKHWNEVVWSAPCSDHLLSLEKTPGRQQSLKCAKGKRDSPVCTVVQQEEVERIPLAATSAPWCTLFSADALGLTSLDEWWAFLRHCRSDVRPQRSIKLTLTFPFPYSMKILRVYVADYTGLLYFGASLVTQCLSQNHVNREDITLTRKTVLSFLTFRISYKYSGRELKYVHS
ncbi:hypothetical protein ANN_17501 [Periplaneta americana]|uniref:Uncharacterized protein n=1 Tax=Periplaneta americana TaxID=6978 RepID=A0ABQ8SUD9_PERAM|nr:hypothetical protein ANN_17501 [Periplaneta americana]